MKVKKVLKKILTVALSLSMFAGSFVIPAEAADKYNYVTIGASNTNGYGMRGYITEDELNAILSGEVSKDDVNVYGYKRSPEGAYTDLVRDYLGGPDNVDLSQLAISSMRAEEVRILLDDTYMGDDYSEWRFTGSDGWFYSAEKGEAADSTEALANLRKAYRDSITNADLITVDIGWNNFGVYVCNQLSDYLSNGRLKWSAELTNIYDTPEELAAAEEAKVLIGEYVKQNIDDAEMADVVTKIFTYSILGYMHNFDIVMEKIYELNPDADVVVLGIQNLLHGVVVDVNGNQVPLGQIFGNFVNMANYYTSVCSPYQDKYLYVKAGGEDEHVTLFLDDIKSYDGDAENLNQNVKDCFDYYDNDLYTQMRVDYMAEMVIEEEYGDMLSLAGMTAKEAVAAGKKGELPVASIQEKFDGIYWPALYAAYDTLAELVKTVANYPSVDANGLLSGSVDIGAVEDAMAAAIEAEIQENALQAAEGVEYTVDVDKILPDSNTKVVAAMYIYYYMGNSFFAHPSETGHVEIKDAIVSVINNPASEKDQAIADYLADTVKEIQQLFCEVNGHDYVNGVCQNCGKEKEESTDPVEPTNMSVTRIYGETRFETCFSVADAYKEELGVDKFDAVIIADGMNFPDALSGSYLAGKKNAPILMTNGKNVDELTAYVNANLNSDGTIYILGGVNAVSAKIENGFSGYTVKRLAGADRYDTNLKILEEAGIGNEPLLICSGNGFADSLSASATEKPILLVGKKLTEGQKALLEKANGNFYVIGGTVAVSQSVENAVANYGTVERVGGATRFETSVLIVEEFFANPEAVVLAYGQNFPDGLCGGPLAISMNAPLILTASKSSDAAEDFMNGKSIQSCVILGGPSLISDEAVRNILSLDSSFEIEVY